MFEKILIANRGEIAVRIIRACRQMGISTVAVYSQADEQALHVRLADEAICIGPAPAAKSYLNMEQILSAAVLTGADAIHPGYGLLSENSLFAQKCRLCGIAFIGPSPEAIQLLGNKTSARSTMQSAGVPVIPGSGAVTDTEHAVKEAESIGYPVMIKAASGGGGKGIRKIENSQEMRKTFPLAMEEARRAFGDDTMYVEKLIVHPRHIEFQIMADSHGNIVHIGERDCSVQRNHQKMIEEAPAWNLSESLRRRMGESAVRAARAAGYTNAGTVEFLLEPTGKYYFMEMNTRIQVEHPVTEEVSGIDLVCEQIRIAAGMELSFSQEDIRLGGHAIECRINAEDPSRNFAPSPGKIHSLCLPGGKGVRVDSCAYCGYEISPYYDSMIAKIIVHGDTRTEAIDKMKAALGEIEIDGIHSNISYLSALLSDAGYCAGKTDIDFCDTFRQQRGM